jgi:hypothetical protein
MHAKVKTMQKETSAMTKRKLPGGSKTARKFCKNLKAGDRLEGRKLRKSEVKQEQRQE